MMRGKSALWEGHKDTCTEQGRAELEDILSSPFPGYLPCSSSGSREDRCHQLLLRVSGMPVQAERSREGLPVCGPLFFLSPSLPYFLFIVSLGNVLILNLIQKDIHSQFGVTSLNLWKMVCDRWDFLFFRILTSKVFLSCFKLEVDINGTPSKDLYSQALLKRFLTFF